MTGTELPLIATAAAVTYATRFAGLSLGAWEPPVAVRTFLAYVPVAAFAALVAPDLVRGDGDLSPRLIGAVLAAVVVAKTGKLWACIAVGLATYWAARLAGL